MATPFQVIERTERLVEAELCERRWTFGATIGNATAGFDLAGKFASRSHRQHLRHLCETELRERGRVLVHAFIAAHAAMSAKPSEDHRRSAKVWIDKSVSAEAKDLEQFLWKPRAALGETGTPDHLDVQLWHEIDRAHVRIDDELNRIGRNRVECVRRWIVRGIAPFITPFRRS